MDEHYDFNDARECEYYKVKKKKKKKLKKKKRFKPKPTKLRKKIYLC